MGAVRERKKLKILSIGLAFLAEHLVHEDTEVGTSLGGDFGLVHSSSSNVMVVLVSVTMATAVTVLSNTTISTLTPFFAFVTTRLLIGSLPRI